MNFVIRISNSLLRDKDQDPTALGSLQRLEEISKFTFREYIVDQKNTYKLALAKCFVKLSLYVKDSKNFIELNDQGQYTDMLKALNPEIQ